MQTCPHSLHREGRHRVTQRFLFPLLKWGEDLCPFFGDLLGEICYAGDLLHCQYYKIDIQNLEKYLDRRCNM